MEWLKSVIEWLKGVIEEKEKTQEEIEKAQIEGLITVLVFGLIVVVGSCIYWWVVGGVPPLPGVQEVEVTAIPGKTSEVEQGWLEGARGRRIKRYVILAGVFGGVVGGLALVGYFFGGN